jgi:hypothetical protein
VCCHDDKIRVEALGCTYDRVARVALHHVRFRVHFSVWQATLDLFERMRRLAFAELAWPGRDQ